MKNPKHLRFPCASVCFIISFLFSNAQSFEWAVRMGGPNGEFPRSLGIDGLGNIYTMGFFLGTADFDPGANTYNLSSAGGTDVFICKTDSSGNFIWAKRIGGASDETGYCIAVDNVGNIYATGSFKDTADFDPGMAYYNLYSAAQDIFICKLNSSGNFEWALSLAGTVNAEGEGSGIALDNAGNIFTTGYFKDSVDFDPGSGVYYMYGGTPGDAFVCKHDTAGNFLWAGKMGGTATDKGTAVKTDASGNVCITGTFQTNADFDPGNGSFNLLSNGQFDIFICKLDPSGNFIWAKSFGGTNSDYGNALAIDSAENVFTSGQYFSTVDFDPGSATYPLTSAGTWDIYINKLDASGNFIWAKSMGGLQGDEGFGLFADASGNTYAAGKYRDVADFDPGSGVYNLSSLGNYDIYIGKYDTAGNLVWVFSMGDTIVDYAYPVIADAAGNVYTVGSFDGTIDFDPGVPVYNLTSAGLSDIFILKLSELVAGFPENNSAHLIKVYPNPTNDFFIAELPSRVFDLFIYDVGGRKVSERKSANSQIKISTSSLQPGIYFLKISSGDQAIYYTELVIIE